MKKDMPFGYHSCQQYIKLYMKGDQASKCNLQP